MFGGVFADLGLCLGGCTVLGDDSGCADGEVCVFSARVGTDADGDQVAVGFCAPGGEGGTGDACALDDDGNSDCANGHICAAAAQGDDPSCIRLCEDVDGGANGCPDDLLCIVDLFGADALGEGASRVIGACLAEDPRADDR